MLIMGKTLKITQELIKQNPNIDFNDFKYRSGSRTKLYKGYCPDCGKDRGYISSRSRWSSLCRSCNGVISGSFNMKDKTPHNKGKSSSLSQRVKQSCSHRGIDISEFDGFLYENKKRHKYNNSGLRDQCFSSANHTCAVYDVKGVKLNAHHLDSWHSNEEKRFNIDNLVCLSEEAHKTFHNIYGRKDNTTEQYKEFKAEIDTYKQTKQDLFLVAGCPASGKSWVCEQLKDKFNYVPYDGINSSYHIYELLKNNNKPLLYDPTIKISTFIKRYGHLFNIRLVVIVEDEKIVNSRMLSRGGKITKTINNRIKRMSSLAKGAEFSGTSSEIFNYINNQY